VYQGINLVYQRCSQDPESPYYHPECVDDATYQAWFKKATIQEIMVSSFFDGTDYENPIHYYLDDMWVSLQYGRSIVYQTFI
jgi:hypothetical protein